MIHVWVSLTQPIPLCYTPAIVSICSNRFPAGHHYGCTFRKSPLIYYCCSMGFEPHPCFCCLQVQLSAVPCHYTINKLMRQHQRFVNYICGTLLICRSEFPYCCLIYAHMIIGHVLRSRQDSNLRALSDQRLSRAPL